MAASITTTPPSPLPNFGIVASFKPNTMQTVLWHSSQVMFDLMKTEKAGILPYLVSTMEGKKLISIPKISTVYR